MKYINDVGWYLWCVYFIGKNMFFKGRRVMKNLKVFFIYKKISGFLELDYFLNF